MNEEYKLISVNHQGSMSIIKCLLYGKHCAGPGRGVVLKDEQGDSVPILMEMTASN